MSWVSYAQNAEDVRLHRAFAGQPSGFYIDVGANNPVYLSVTKHFYDCGWTGINVEPAPEPFALIERDRTRDINVNVGCSNQEGTLALHTAVGDASGLSSFTAKEVAVHEQRGYKFEPVSVRVVTLASICEQHVNGRQIDFMSIDVEGHEREVLEGADFDRFRPRVIVIESTLPNTTISTHERWEDLIVSHNYTFAVFDGLNRYYVRREDEYLLPIVALAPNIFDDYVPYIYKRQIDALETELIPYRAANSVLRSMATATSGAVRLTRKLLHRS
jgi:FkbM family methyltransferase